MPLSNRQKCYLANEVGQFIESLDGVGVFTENAKELDATLSSIEWVLDWLVDGTAYTQEEKFALIKTMVR